MRSWSRRQSGKLIHTLCSAIDGAAYCSSLSGLCMLLAPFNCLLEEGTMLRMIQRALGALLLAATMASPALAGKGETKLHWYGHAA